MCACLCFTCHSRWNTGVKSSLTVKPTHRFECKHTKINNRFDCQSINPEFRDRFSFLRAKESMSYCSGRIFPFLWFKRTNQLLSRVQFFGPWHCSSLSRKAEMILSKGWRTTWAIGVKTKLQGFSVTRYNHDQNQQHHDICQQSVQICQITKRFVAPSSPAAWEMNILMFDSHQVDPTLTANRPSDGPNHYQLC